MAILIIMALGSVKRPICPSSSSVTNVLLGHLSARGSPAPLGHLPRDFAVASSRWRESPVTEPSSQDSYLPCSRACHSSRRWESLWPSHRPCCLQLPRPSIRVESAWSCRLPDGEQWSWGTIGGKSPMAEKTRGKVHGIENTDNSWNFNCFDRPILKKWKIIEAVWVAISIIFT